MALRVEVVLRYDCSSELLWMADAMKPPNQAVLETLLEQGPQFGCGRFDGYKLQSLENLREASNSSVACSSKKGSTKLRPFVKLQCLEGQSAQDPETIESTTHLKQAFVP
jgi:hypothetical protein